MARSGRRLGPNNKNKVKINLYPNRQQTPKCEFCHDAAQPIPWLSQIQICFHSLIKRCKFLRKLVSHDVGAHYCCKNVADRANDAHIGEKGWSTQTVMNMSWHIVRNISSYKFC